jgi:hypothetical protein
MAHVVGRRLPKERPHQGIAIATPANRFTVADRTGRPPDATALDRTGDTWVTRRVTTNGVISVAHQQISVRRHRHGEVVDVHLNRSLLQIRSGAELLKTIVRTEQKEVRKKRAAHARRPSTNPRPASHITRRHRNPSPEDAEQINRSRSVPRHPKPYTPFVPLSRLG